MPLTQDEISELQAKVTDLVSKKSAEDSADGESDAANAALQSAQTLAATKTAAKNSAADATAQSLGDLRSFVDGLAAPPAPPAP